MTKLKKIKFVPKNRQKKSPSKDELFCKKNMKPWSPDPLKQLLFLINQYADLGASNRAINTYYKMKGFYRRNKKKS